MLLVGVAIVVNFLEGNLAQPDRNLMCIPFCLMILLVGIYLKDIVAMCTCVYLPGCSLKCCL